MGRIGSLANEAVPYLIETLKDPDERVRKTAVGTLGEIGPAATEAVPHLSRLLTDLDPYVRGYVAIALGQIGEEAIGATPQLIEALRGCSWDDRAGSAGYRYSSFDSGIV